MLLFTAQLKGAGAPHSPAALTLVILSCLLSGTASAAVDTETVPLIQVTASHLPLPVEDSLAQVWVLDRAAIDAAQAADLPQLLQQLPGVQISRNGGAGQVSSLFLRGAESDHILVLVNGVRVGSATLGTTALELIPLDQVERVELLAGPRSALHGSEAVGGVLQIFTRRGEGPLRPRLRLGLGTQGTAELSLGLAGRRNGTSLQLGLDGTRTQGFNACRGNPGLGGCYTDQPDQDGFARLSLSLGAGVALGENTDLELRWLRADGKSEFDGAYQDSTDFQQQVFSGQLNHFVSDAWEMEFLLGRSWDDMANALQDTHVNDFNTRRDSLSWRNHWTLHPQHSLSLGIDWLDDQVTATQAYDQESRSNTGVFAQYRGAGTGQRWELALRRDDNQAFGQASSGNLGWGLTLAPGRQLRLGYGHAFKTPTFNDLYYPGFGNPDLQPETADSLELGLSGGGPQGSAGHWSLNLYHTAIDDLIGFNPTTYAVENIDRARIFGLEGLLTSHLAGWTLTSGFSLQDPENRSAGANAGKQLPRRSEWNLSLDLSRPLGRWDLGMALNATGASYDDPANNLPLDPRLLVKVRVMRQLAPAWRLGLSIDNLFDEDAESSAYYHQPGSSALLSLYYQP